MQEAMNVGSAAAATKAPVSHVFTAPQSNSALPNVGPNAPAGKTAQIMIPHVDQGFDNDAEAAKGNKYPTSRTVTATMISYSGAGANASTKVNLLNADIFPCPTTNGKGANSIVTTYQDGTTNGVLVSEVLTRARNGVGAVCFGIAQRCLVASGGSPVADPNSIANLNGNWLTYTVKGNTISDEFDENADQSRNDYDQGIIVSPCVQNIARQVTFSFNISAQTSASAGYYNSINTTFYLTRKFKK